MAHPRFLWEVTIDASNDALEFDEGGGPLTALLTHADYYLRGGGVAGTDLLQHIAAQMSAVGANTYGVTRDSSGTVTIARTAGVAAFSLHWNSGPADTQAIANILGYSTLADDGPGTSFPGDFQHRYGWYPEQHLLDGRRRFETATAGASRSLGHQQYTQQWETDWRAVARIDFVRQLKVRYADVDGTVLGAINQAFSSGPAGSWEGFYDAARRGVRFEFHPDESIISAATAVIDPGAQDWFEDIEAAAELLLERGERYRVTVPMRPYQA